jgi:hypothetical protein
MATTGRITRASAVEALEGDMRCAAAIVQKIAQKVPFFFFCMCRSALQAAQGHWRTFHHRCRRGGVSRR